MFEFDTIELLGLIAGTLTTSSFVPQVYKTWKEKSTKDEDVGMPDANSKDNKTNKEEAVDAKKVYTTVMSAKTATRLRDTHAQLSEPSSTDNDQATAKEAS